MVSRSWDPTPTSGMGERMTMLMAMTTIMTMTTMITTTKWTLESLAREGEVEVGRTLLLGFIIASCS